MKKRTLYTLPKSTEITGKVIATAIKDNEANLATFMTLESYMDDEPIMGRAAPNDLLTINNFADYITSVNTGYMLGNPVDYRGTKEQNLDPVVENYKGQSIFNLDSDLGMDCSMFGQAFENIYVDENSTVRSAKMSVYNTIVVYDDTFKHDKLFAIYYSPLYDEKGNTKQDMYDVTVWTASHVLSRQLNGEVMTETAPDEEHFFGDVPVVHYMNNKRLKGDYEPVITLIDAYNILQSDRVLDREKLVDAILAFYGARLTAEDQAAIKENRTIGLPEGAKAEYLIKNLDEAGADVLRKTIAADIHKFSKTPDLTDETFSNAPSGVSILYKLLAFEQNTKKKERLFEHSLKERFDMYATMLRKQSKMSETVNGTDIDIVFRRALPKNDFETSQLINNLEGLVSNETLVGQLSFVNDASQEVEKAEKERDVSLQTGNFASDTFVKA